MKLLIAGGAGFLGSHLCQSLLRLKHEVVVIDNFYTGRLENLDFAKNNPKLKIIEHDVTTPIAIQVDGIFNLACPASPIHYQHNPLDTIKTSFLGALNLLDLATELSVPILQASTSEVYGDPAFSPQHESYWGNVNPIGVRACYDEGKRAAETLFFDYHREKGTTIKVARIFNTYGPRMSMNDGRVVTNFLYSAINETPITIYGDGSQTRSFCFVDDLIQGLIALFFTSDAVTGPMNLGNPSEYSMLELAEMILELTDSKSELEFLPLPQDDPKQRKPDIAQAKEILNWSPAVSLKDGLSQTLEFIKGNY
jgi:UDP-glucuronate decarboxylase